MFNFVRIRTHSKFPLQSLPSATRKSYQLLGFAFKALSQLALAYLSNVSPAAFWYLPFSSVWLQLLEHTIHCHTTVLLYILALYRLSSSLLYLPSEYLLKFQEYSSTPSSLKTLLRNNLFLPLLCSFTINISTQYFLPVSMSSFKGRNPVSLIFIIHSPEDNHNTYLGRQSMFLNEDFTPHKFPPV